MKMGDERGSATVWTVALMTVLLLAGCLALTVAQVVLVRQRLASAADLAAVAAAQQPAQGCARAAHFAHANGVDLDSCWFDGLDHWVVVKRGAPSLLVRIATLVGAKAQDLRVTSRAGPGLRPAIP